MYIKIVGLSTAIPVALSIADLTGRQVFSTKLVVESDCYQTYTLDLPPDLRSSVYIFKVSQGQKVYTEKIVIG